MLTSAIRLSRAISAVKPPHSRMISAVARERPSGLEMIGVSAAVSSAKRRPTRRAWYSPSGVSVESQGALVAALAVEFGLAVADEIDHFAAV